MKVRLGGLFQSLVFVIAWRINAIRQKYFSPDVAPVVQIPREILPLTYLGSVIMQYCAFTNREPEELKASAKLAQLVERGTGDHELHSTLLEMFIHGSYVTSTFDWLVSIGDAKHEEREAFFKFATISPVIPA